MKLVETMEIGEPVDFCATHTFPFGESGTGETGGAGATSGT